VLLFTGSHQLQGFNFAEAVGGKFEKESFGR